MPVYDANGEPIVGKDGKALREVALDPDRAAIWRRIFDLIEEAHTPGEVAEILNRDRLRAVRGGKWNRKTIRRGVGNAWYAGKASGYGEQQDDHEPLIDPDRWAHIQTLLKRDDDVGERARKGGRPTSANDYLLRGIASCEICGEALYTRRLAGGRHYRCRAAREGLGTCDAPYIPAEPMERAVLDHLDCFIANVRGWLESGPPQRQPNANSSPGRSTASGRSVAR